MDEIKVITTGDYRKCVSKSLAKSEAIRDKVVEAASSGFFTLRNFLNKRHSQKMKGTKDNVNILKFEADDGDRVLFTWFNNHFAYDSFSCLSIVLLDYVSHDEQGKSAISKDWINDKKSWETFTNNENETYEIAEVTATTDRLKNFDQKDWFFLPHNLFQQESDEFYEPVLIDEQSKVLTLLGSDCPLYIGGGAGSGKTILAVQLLLKYQCTLLFSNNKDGTIENTDIEDSTKYAKAAYFTLSKTLKGDAQKQYINLCKNKNISKNPNIYFYDIFSYLADKTALNKNTIVKFEIFNNNFLNYYLKTKYVNLFNKIDLNMINSYSIWTQIRGVLKGYMGDEWFKPVWHKISEYGDSIYTLDEFNIINRSNTLYNGNNKIADIFRLKNVLSKKDINNINNYLKNTNLDDNKRKIIKSQIEDINKKSKEFDPNNINLSYSDYSMVSDQISPFSEDQKRVIYEIFKMYLEWLEKYPYVDENDIAAKIIGQVKNDGEKYTLIVVDEVQDLTEVQIFLLTQLLNDSGIIVFTGDIHQIINPTFFDTSRLRDYFYSRFNEYNSSTLEEAYLTYNHRSQKEIIELANKLSKIRKKKISKSQQETEEDQKAIKDNGVKPFLLSYDKEYRNQMISEIQKPFTAVVVSSENEKNRLLEELGSEGIDKESIKNLYTINDIKGMEYKYVFCYNLVADYEKEWIGILAQEPEELHRYYFNLLYVAITRSTDYLYLMDDIKNDELKKWYRTLSDNQMSAFDPDLLYIKDLDNTTLDDWLASAKEHEKHGQDNISNLDKAMYYYKKSECKNCDFYIKRCKAQKMILEQKYDEGFALAISIGDLDRAEECASNIENGKEKLELISLIKEYKEDPLNKEARYLHMLRKIKSLGLSENICINIVNLIFNDDFLDSFEKIMSKIIANFSSFNREEK